LGGLYRCQFAQQLLDCRQSHIKTITTAFNLLRASMIKEMAESRNHIQSHAAAKHALW
jgi:hypothetical protein